MLRQWIGDMFKKLACPCLFMEKKLPITKKNQRIMPPFNGGGTNDTFSYLSSNVIPPEL